MILDGNRQSEMILLALVLVFFFATVALYRIDKLRQRIDDLSDALEEHFAQRSHHRPDDDQR